MPQIFFPVVVFLYTMLYWLYIMLFDSSNKGSQLLLPWWGFAALLNLFACLPAHYPVSLAVLSILKNSHPPPCSLNYHVVTINMLTVVCSQRWWVFCQNVHSWSNRTNSGKYPVGKTFHTNNPYWLRSALMLSVQRLHQYFFYKLFLLWIMSSSGKWQREMHFSGSISCYPLYFREFG